MENAVLTIKEAEENFIYYTGGAQPVSDETEIEIKLRCGGDHVFKGYTGRTAPWFDRANGVTAYKIIEKGCLC